jgi:hypothetical protein
VRTRAAPWNDPTRIAATTQCYKCNNARRIKT